MRLRWETIRVLFVDDSSMDTELALDAFRQAGLAERVEILGGGQQALDYLFGVGRYSDRVRYPLPDVVLLDLKMPVIDGFEVLRRAKSTPVLRRIPIVVLTSSREEGDRALSYDIGANSYLVKPASFEAFVGVMATIGDYWLSLNENPPLGEPGPLVAA